MAAISEAAPEKESGFNTTRVDGHPDVEIPSD
jgi:hypothetical protein